MQLYSIKCSSYFATGSSPYSICSSVTASIPTKLHPHSSNAQVYGMYYTENNKAQDLSYQQIKR